MALKKVKGEPMQPGLNLWYKILLIFTIFTLLLILFSLLGLRGRVSEVKFPVDYEEVGL